MGSDITSVIGEKHEILASQYFNQKLVARRGNTPRG